MNRVKRFRLDSEGIPLACALFTPGDAGPFPGLVICHGMPAGSPSILNAQPGHDGLDYPALADLCASQGFATAIFNFRGTGESAGNFHPLGWAHDLGTMLSWMQQNPLVDGDRIAVLGSSLGAAISIYVTAHRPEVAGLVTFASPAVLEPRAQPAKAVDTLRKLGVIRDPDFPSSLEAWNSEYAELNPLDWISRVAPRPLLILQGEADDVVPPQNAGNLFDMAGEPKEIKLLPGVGHRFRNEPVAVSTALEWLKVELLP